MKIQRVEIKITADTGEVIENCDLRFPDYSKKTSFKVLEKEFGKIVKQVQQKLC